MYHRSQIGAEFFFSFIFFFFLVILVIIVFVSSSSSSLPLSICSLLSSFFFSSSLFSSLSPFCYACSSIFVNFFLADVDECTSSTPVCGIHFNCINTLGSYRCDHNHSCQGKKSMNYLFSFFFFISDRSI